MTMLRCGPHVLDLTRPRVMGILNVTPDSFSDGGRFFDRERALDHARRMLADGADLIDVGGESTRPGAAPVDEAGELARVIPVIDELAREGALVSVDTMKPAVMRAAVAAGAAMINDVNALRLPGALEAAASTEGGGVPDAHAGRAAHDAGRAELRRRRGGGARLPRRARAVLRSRRHRARSHRARPRLRLRQDACPQPGARACAAASSWRPATRCSRGCRASPRSARSPAGRAASGSRRVSPRRWRRSRAVRRSCGSTTCARPSTR